MLLRPIYKFNIKLANEIEGLKVGCCFYTHHIPRKEFYWNFLGKALNLLTHKIYNFAENATTVSNTHAVHHEDLFPKKKVGRNILESNTI